MGDFLQVYVGVQTEQRTGSEPAGALGGGHVAQVAPDTETMKYHAYC